MQRGSRRRRPTPRFAKKIKDGNNKLHSDGVIPPEIKSFSIRDSTAHGFGRRGKKYSAVIILSGRRCRRDTERLVGASNCRHPQEIKFPERQGYIFRILLFLHTLLFIRCLFKSQFDEYGSTYGSNFQAGSCQRHKLMESLVSDEGDTPLSANGCRI